MDFKIRKLDGSALNCPDLSTRNCLISCSRGYYTNNHDEKVEIDVFIPNSMKTNMSSSFHHLKAN